MSEVTGSYMRVEIDPLYTWVMMGAAVYAFIGLLIGFLVAGSKRSSLFTAEKLNKKYGEEHKKEFGVEIPKGGYPDHGNGLYSDLLTYKEWMDFSIDQRVHRNYMENVTIGVFLCLVLGLMWPITALCLTGA